MKKKSIGITIFSVACAIYVKTEFLDPKPPAAQPVVRWTKTQPPDPDPFGLIHKLRFYVLGIGGIGLLIAAEDILIQRTKRKKAAEPGVHSESSGRAFLP